MTACFYDYTKVTSLKFELAPDKGIDLYPTDEVIDLDTIGFDDRCRPSYNWGWYSM